MRNTKYKENAYGFIECQINDIRKGGVPVFFRKLLTLLVHLLSSLFIPLIFIIRLLRPLVLIRFGFLISTRMGHYAANTELYLCERNAGFHQKRTFDIFFNGGMICNQQLKKMWDRTRAFRIWSLARYFYISNKLLPGYKKHVIPLPSDRDIHGLLERTPIHLSFTLEEEERGRAKLREIGVPEGARFICFHARDSAYLDETFPEGEWAYHNYRDSDIDSFIPSIEELAGRGYYVLRMGAKPNKPLEVNHPHITDYATKVRTEFLDIFLGAKCFFDFGDSCGINAIPIVFRRPVATTNTIPLEYLLSWWPHYLFIPKKLWIRKEQRFMTFREILESGAGRFLHTEQYEQMGLDIVNNTPDEITALVIEMDERLKRSWHTTKEDEELQQRFWSLFKPSELHGTIKSRIGADFLRENQNLLE